MQAIARVYYWAAQLRRSRGAYDKTTLSFFRKAYEILDCPTYCLAHARLYRDINGSIDETLLTALQTALIKTQVESQRYAIETLISESLHQRTGLVINKNKTSPNRTQPTCSKELLEINDMQAQWREELTDFIYQKIVAVVGNSACLRNSNLGKKIDQQDIVCRFNRYPRHASHAPDTGQRIDIWITSPEVLNEQLVLPESVRWIIISGGDVRFTLRNWSGCHDYLKQQKRIITIPIKCWSNLVQQLKAPPSAGLLWTNYLISLGLPGKNIQLYGFGKNNTRSKQYHIISPQYKASKRHAWQDESTVIKDLKRQGKITTTQTMTLGVFTRGLARNTYIKKHLQTNDVILVPNKEKASSLDIIVGWGRKKNTQKAKLYAEQNYIQYASVEDGFIHSMSQGRLGASSWSLVIDKTGLFYDATQTSDLEQLINASSLSEQQYSRARTCLKLITDHHITKYNNAKLQLPESLQRYTLPILVIDQVDGDTSIPYALASKDNFEQMLAAAISENPDSDILIKTHPDVMAGKRKGCLTLNTPLPSNVHLLSDNINSLVLMKQVKKVYVVSSQTGFEALLLNKPVVCFGAPFYAGWGLTDDRLPTDLPVFQRRSARPDLLTLFHATHIQYSRYLDPISQRPCELEAVLNYVKLQYKHYQKNTGKLFCFGFPLWKKRFVPYYLKSPDNEIHFIRNEAQAQKLGCDESSRILIWSSRHEAAAKKIVDKTSAKLIKIEDGFLRSINLGSNYAPPSSLVFDSRGIYFDPNQPSDLEHILLYHQFDEALITRAKNLRTQITALEISKYNVGTRQSENLFHCPEGKTVILIPGQVADDASIKLGCKDIKENLGLIKLVRQRNPDAYIAYKPHPDVVSKNRKGELSWNAIESYCDQIVYNTSITDCLKQADEVHTLTSLVGFEALMRELPVYCYGLPFYAGWGLTQDEHTIPRRNRQLTLDALVAGTLIVYPRYFDWTSRSFTTPERLTDELHLRKTNHTPSKTLQDNALVQKIDCFLNLIKAVISPSFK
ncbi:glycosyltransferase family 29 protein [Leucothrix mucor]|uniref:glycosyltransferase family 29 protein n=1 Tax=Leucothrix mucor TaxID=45248 RepID=UPI0003B6D357|nr:glycosyltransferase family 29 protein [Leucothrix mucor]